MGLIGIWKNKTLQEIIGILGRQMKWTEELAMDRAKDLACINMRGAVEIERRVTQHRSGMMNKIQEAEKEMIKFSKGEPSTWTHYEIGEEERKQTTAIRDRMNLAKGYIHKDTVQMMNEKLEASKKRRNQAQESSEEGEDRDKPKRQKTQETGTGNSDEQGKRKTNKQKREEENKGGRKRQTRKEKNSTRGTREQRRRKSKGKKDRQADRGGTVKHRSRGWAISTTTTFPPPKGARATAWGAKSRNARSHIPTLHYTTLHYTTHLTSETTSRSHKGAINQAKGG